jgi:hypothetical protein
MILHKEYEKLNDHEIKFSIVFNKSLTNWATNQPKKVGYYVSVMPVKRTNQDGFSIEESGAFTGFNACLLEVDRQSKKRLAAALAILQEKKGGVFNLF